MALAQAISPIATRFTVAWSVCLSVCRLTHPCTPLKHFDGFRYHLARSLHLQGPMTHCVRWGSLNPREKGNFGVEPPTKTCTCLRMIHQVAAPISDFAFYRISSVTCLYRPSYKKRVLSFFATYWFLLCLHQPIMLQCCITVNRFSK